MSPDYLFGLKGFKNVHLLFLLIGPLWIRHAMDLYQIKIVGVKFLSESINYYISIGTFRFWYTSSTDPYFGTQGIVFPGNTLKSRSCKRMGSIAVGTIKESDS